MPRQTSIQLAEATERQVQALQSQGFGSFTDIVRLAIDRMYREEIPMSEKLTYEQKSAAVLAHRLRSDAKTNNTTPEAFAASLGIESEMVKTGLQILDAYVVHHAGNSQTMAGANIDADDLEDKGYQTVFEEIDGINRFSIYGLRPK